MSGPGRPRHDLTGMVYGDLTVLKMLEYPYVECLCRCGNVCKIQGHTITTGQRKSCGCLVRLVNEDKKRLFTEEEKKALHDCSSGIISLKECSEIIGVTRQRVSQLLQKSGMGKIRKKGRNSKSRKLLIDYYESYRNGTISVEELSVITKLNKVTVVSYLSAAKVYRNVPIYKTCNSEKRLVISDDDCNRYRRKEVGIKELAEQYGTNEQRMRISLTRQGCIKRGRLDAIELSNEDIDSLVSRKTTITRMAVDKKVSRRTIVTAMWRQQVEIPEPFKGVR